MRKVLVFPFSNGRDLAIDNTLSGGLCLIGSTPTANYEEEELPPDPSEETLTIEARFQPLLPESMTKSKDGFLGVSWGRRGRGPPRDRTRDGGPSVCTRLLRVVCALLVFPPFLPSFIQCPLCTQHARPCAHRPGPRSGRGARRDEHEPVTQMAP